MPRREVDEGFLRTLWGALGTDLTTFDLPELQYGSNDVM